MMWMCALFLVAELESLLLEIGYNKNNLCPACRKQ